MNDDMTCIAIFTAAHGVRGQMKLRSYMQQPDALFTNPYASALCTNDGAVVVLKRCGVFKEQFIVEIQGITSRNDAELWVRRELFIPRAILPEPEDGEFYLDDLVGLQVRNAQGATIGRVLAVHNYGAGDILELELEGETEEASKTVELVSFTHDTIPQIDMEEGWLEYSPPEVI